MRAVDESAVRRLHEQVDVLSRQASGLADEPGVPSKVL
ncbi:hypothetical protein VAB18032_24275 [Micromonospora maris AB-18-032]|nr:hypothetical protein VAB18032_24275 [Micromonospora maris AB-18-032]